MALNNAEKQALHRLRNNAKMVRYEQALQDIAVWDVWCRADAQDVVEIARLALNPIANKSNGTN